MATTLAELDFTAGLRLRSFRVPPMPATVRLENGEDGALDGLLIKDFTAFRTAEEVASAVSVPFVPWVGELESPLGDFLGKSARVDAQRPKLYEQANKLLALVPKIDGAKAGAANAKKLATLGKHVTALLDRIHELARSIAGDNAFHQRHVERIQAYHALDGRALAAALA